MPQAQRPAFYMGLAYLLVACVVAGFWPTYYGAVLGTGIAPPHPGWIIHAHAAVFLGWMLAFAVQTTLVWRGRTDLHRTLGVALAGYGMAAIAFGVYASVQLELHRYSYTQDLDHSARHPFLNLGTIGLFAGFLVAAIRRRHRPELHKRLMVVATCSLASPGVARLGMKVLELLGHPAVIQLFLLTPLLLCAAYDLATRRSVHPVILLGLLLNFLLFNHGPLARTKSWHFIGRAILRPFL